jgi:DNA-binding beta-propeller fold protein YncE
MFNRPRLGASDMLYRLLLLALIIIIFVLSNAACQRQTSSPIPTIIPLEVTPVDLLTEVVVEADCIALGTITDKQYDTTSNIVYTIFTLSVEKMIRGNPDSKEMFIKLPGGETDEYSMIIPGALYFSVPETVLLCLKKMNADVYSVMPNGVLWGKSDVVSMQIDLSTVIGRVVLIMKDNNIPVALSPDAIPQLSTQILPDGTSIGFDKASFIYVCNYRKGTIYIYNLGSFKLISQIFVGKEAMIVPSPSNSQLCAMARSTNMLSLINMKTNALEKEITLSETPGDVTYISNSNDICVTLPASKQIQVLKAPLFNVEKTFTLEEFPDRIDASPDGRMVYITTGSNPWDATEHLLALDLTTGIKAAEIDLVKDWHELALPKKGHQIYVTNRSSCTISKINTSSFQIEDIFSNITKRQFPDATIGEIVLSPDNNYLFFNDDQADYIRAINLRTSAIDKELSVENGSWGIYISNSGHYLLTVAPGGIGIETGDKQPGSVTIIDTASWKVICRIWIDNGAIEVVGNKAF